MARFKEFFKSTLIGGLLVVLPLAIFLFAITWIFGLIRSIIAPLSRALVQDGALPDLVVDILVLGLILFACFAIGVFVRTRLGRWSYAAIESSLLLKAPGYGMIKETVLQFAGNKRSPFGAVALAQIFGNETMVSSFITDEHDDGSVTVFVPTGPNPTSGNIYHLPARYVHRVDVSVENAMRSIISCGAGSATLIRKREDGTA